MRLVKPSYKILSIMAAHLDEDGVLLNTDNSLRLIEVCGRTCYKSEGAIETGSNRKFVQKIMDLNHESVIEHSAMTVKFICDRGVSHELVRHRLASFSQESTRYCNYKDEVTFVIPPWITTLNEGLYTDPLSVQSSDDRSYYGVATCRWTESIFNAEIDYQALLFDGWSPQQARSVLPNSTKTEIVVTANFREWRHIFKLRTAPAAHPQMRELMIPLLEECQKLIPVIFDDIKGE